MGDSDNYDPVGVANILVYTVFHLCANLTNQMSKGGPATSSKVSLIYELISKNVLVSPKLVTYLNSG